MTHTRMNLSTCAYVERAAEGRIKREIRRRLQRYLVRQIDRQLNTAASADDTLAEPA